VAARERLDPSREFVAARALTFLGTRYAAGDRFPKDVPTPQRLATLYNSRRLDHAPEVPDEPADQVVVEAQRGGYYLVSAPWSEPTRERGRRNAEAAAQALRDAGEPEEWGGVRLTAGENGWHEVAADWLDEPEKIHGEEAARRRAADLRQVGDPAADRMSAE
jgi:hypothetical protein